jgi:hypothetical protein
MDELQLLRDCLPEQQPPSLHVTEAARRRMRDGRRSRRVPLAGVRPDRRELLLRVGVPTVGVAAAAALVVGIAATVPASAPARPTAAARPTAPARPTAAEHVGAGYTFYSGALPAADADGTIDGRAVLLTAATQVAKQAQPATERYWVTSATAGNFLRVGPVADPYTILDESQVQYWDARSPKDGTPSNAQQLGAAPVSAADRAAWQQDGSPTVWDYVGQSDGMADAAGYDSGMMRQLSMAGAPLINLTVGYGSQQFAVGNKTLTLAQLQALPADPAKLKKLILSGGVAPGQSASAFLLDGVLPPIMEMPVTPAVRAALYEMLAAMPGIKSLGEVTDPAGQQGEAVSYTATYQNCGQASTLGANGFAVTGDLFSSCTTQEILIINPATGLPLAEELRYVGLPPGQHWTAPDGLFSYEIFGQSHWTNDNPPATAQSSGAPLAQQSPVPVPTGSSCGGVVSGGGTANPTQTPSSRVVCIPVSAGKVGPTG